MGGGASSLHRCRRMFLIRLNNAGAIELDLNHLFSFVSTVEDGNRYVQTKTLAKLLGESVEKVCQLSDRINIKALLHFLESGDQSYMSMTDPVCSSSCLYWEVFDHLQFALDSIEIVKPTVSSHRGAIVAYDHRIGKNTQTTDINLGGEMTNAMWKKHETIIHERIVQYVTIDEFGELHKVIDTDKTQKDIMHIECKSKGLFAHREYTQQEQTETADDDQDRVIRATMECIHFKSSDDEYEFVHSEIPPTSQTDDGDEPQLNGSYLNDSTSSSNNEKHNCSFEDDDTLFSRPYLDDCSDS